MNADEGGQKISMYFDDKDKDWLPIKKVIYQTPNLKRINNSFYLQTLFNDRYYTISEWHIFKQKCKNGFKCDDYSGLINKDLFYAYYL